MTRLEEGIRNCLIDTGRMLEDWKIKVTNREIIGNSDWAMVTVEIYKPRKRKPEITWIIAVNFVRNIIDWDKSEFYR